MDYQLQEATKVPGRLEVIFSTWIVTSYANKDVKITGIFINVKTWELIGDYAVK